MPRIPTDEEYAAYDGAHTFRLWERVGDGWVCPGCGRTRRECLRWALRTPNGRRFWGWIAGLHRHHDHSADRFSILDPRWAELARFPQTVVCDQCNAVDGYVKRVLGLPADFSFSPEEIRAFVVATAHGLHQPDFKRAREIYDEHRVAIGKDSF